MFHVPAAHSKRMENQRGFTLVELAIVALVVGLIIGGIVMATGLVNTGKRHAIIAELGRYRNAVDQFQSKYAAMPGDMSNATTMLSASTANGDGDGWVEWTNETYRAWQMLSLAGLITQTLTGTHTGGSAVLDTNVPASDVAGGYSLIYLDGSATYNGLRGNAFVLGLPVSTSYTYGPGLSTRLAQEIDKATDDAVPSTGNVRVRSGLTGCTSGAGAAMIYDIATSNNVPVCDLLFLY